MIAFFVVAFVEGELRFCRNYIICCVSKTPFFLSLFFFVFCFVLAMVISKDGRNEEIKEDSGYL